MTDALNEALMKLSAARSVPQAVPVRTQQSDAVAQPAPSTAAPSICLQPAEPPSELHAQATTHITPAGLAVPAVAVTPAVSASSAPPVTPAVSAAPVISLAESAPSVSMPASMTVAAAASEAIRSPAEPVPAATPAPSGTLLQKLQGLQKLQELRGWIAAGIALALLVTIWDDLARGRSRTGGVSAEASAVDIDSLLQEFETAEPASGKTVSAASYDDEVNPSTPSATTADYSAASADYSSVPATPATPETAGESVSGAVRFTGRIQPLR